MKSTLVVGSRVAGFVVDSIDDLPEYRGKGLLLTHEATGCQAYHVHCEDPDNLFAFSFKTLPEDSSGVAHILEHTVLCGSEKFPVKDPFLLMLKGSMNTFLNAFTFPDKTVYPASSTVEKDLFNLMEVYGDAVFFPLLMPEMFRQEGHRLEFDADGKLTRTGIVYNEMKGNYSTHDNVAGDWCFRSLFPDTEYAHDSGGDPADIPKLSYEQFKEFHRRYYHPSNTQIFLYGDIPTEKHLEFLQEKFLSRFKKLDIKVAVTDPKPWKKPVRLERTYPSGPEDDEGGKVSITLNWLLSSVGDPEQVLATELLTDILIGSAASPLQRALVDSRLGEDLSGATGLETEISRLTLSVGLRGTEKGREDEIEKLIFKTLKDIAAKGLDAELVEGTIRRYEFRAREIKGGGPFGLRLMRRALRGWLHGFAPAKTLVFDPVMKAVRSKLEADPKYFEGLIQKLLIDNPHRSLVTIVPDGDQNRREQEAELIDLATRQAGLSAPEVERIKAEQKALADYQAAPDSPEASAKIPFLDEADIPLAVPTIAAEDRVIMAEGTVLPVQVHDIFTNGVSYIDLCFDLEHLDDKDLMFMPLYSGIVPGLGLPGQDYQKTANQVSLQTGGIFSFVETSLQARGSARDPEDLHIKLFFRLKTLDTGIGEAVKLLTDIVTKADTSDLDRIADLYIETRNDYRSSIVPSGSSFAAMRAERAQSPSEAIEEAWRGITQQQFLEALAGEDAKSRDRALKNARAEASEEDEGGELSASARLNAAKTISAAINRIRELVVRREGLSVNITASGNALEDCLQAVAEWTRDMPSKEIMVDEEGHVVRDDAHEEAAAKPKRSGKKRGTGGEDFAPAAHGDAPPLEAITVPSKVAFVALSMQASLIGSKGYSSENLLSHLMRTSYLWEHVRMKGGAYGASAGNDGLSGLWTFSSYRDPRITETLDVFKDALKFFADKPVDDRELLLAKIGCVAREIRPLAPSEAGMVAFRRWMYGIGDELRQNKRNDLLAAKSKDLQQAARKLMEGLEKAYAVVIAGPEMVDKEESAHKHFKPARLTLSV